LLIGWERAKCFAIFTLKLFHITAKTRCAMLFAHFVRYYIATEQVCFQLLGVFEEVIGFAPGDLLQRARREPFYVTTVAHYPELVVPPPDGQVRNL
jgi:hypothetical protein